MSSLELNKIAAAILLASLIAMLVGFVANILYKPKLEIVERGYKIEVADDASSGQGSSSAEPEKPVNIAEIMANANAENGAKLIKKCITCHSLNQGGANKVGPNLWKIIGKKKGAHPGFTYSKAMLASGGNWDNESLFRFLKKPSKYMPGTKMSFAGIKKPEDIANVIAYLKENTE